jgi:hypothetical protein
MQIEKKSLVSKRIAIAKINTIKSRCVDLAKPAPSRELTTTCSGKHIKDVTIEM